MNTCRAPLQCSISCTLLGTAARSSGSSRRSGVRTSLRCWHITWWRWCWCGWATWTVTVVGGVHYAHLWAQRDSTGYRKMFKYIHKSRNIKLFAYMADVTFIIFGVIFFLCWAVMFPYFVWSIIRAHVDNVTTDQDGPRPCCIAILVIIMLPNAYWIGLLVQTVRNMMRHDHVDDQRSDDEDKEDNSIRGTKVEYKYLTLCRLCVIKGLFAFLDSKASKQAFSNKNIIYVVSI